MMITLKAEDELRSCRGQLRERGLDFSDPSRVGVWGLLYKLRFRRRCPAPT